MNDIDRIAEAAWRKFAATEAYNTVDFTCSVRAALLEYGALVREDCAKECETIERYWWSEYKTGASRGNSYTEGLADGGAECAAAIREAARKP